jgi:hypothetical protein
MTGHADAVPGGRPRPGTPPGSSPHPRPPSGSPGGRPSGNVGRGRTRAPADPSRCGSGPGRARGRRWRCRGPARPDVSRPARSWRSRAGNTRARRARPRGDGDHELVAVGDHRGLVAQARANASHRPACGPQPPASPRWMPCCTCPPAPFGEDLFDLFTADFPVRRYRPGRQPRSARRAGPQSGRRATR